MTRKLRHRQSVRSTVRVDTYAVVQRAVEEGAAYGWRRAHKHSDKPDESLAIEAIEAAIMSELCAVLRFPRGPSE